MRGVGRTGGGMTSPSLASGGVAPPAQGSLSPQSTLLPAGWPNVTCATAPVYPIQPAVVPPRPFVAGALPQPFPAPASTVPAPVAPPAVPAAAAAPAAPAATADSISFSQYAQLQAEKSTIEVKLNVAEHAAREAEDREKQALSHAAAQRAQYESVIKSLLGTMRQLCRHTNVPEELTSPRRAAIISGLVKKELTLLVAESESEKDLAVTTAEASNQKVDELVVAMNDRDICIATLEDKVNALNEQLRLAAEASPVREREQGHHASPRRERGEDDSLLQWANATEESLNACDVAAGGAAVGGPSPRRPIKTPAVPAQQMGGEWPPSPARNRGGPAPDDVDADLCGEDGDRTRDTLPEEFPQSPRRGIHPDQQECGDGLRELDNDLPPAPRQQQQQQQQGEGWRVNGEEWPPSPRRGMPAGGEEAAAAVAAPANDWSNVTATPDQPKEWLMSPQKNRSSADVSPPQEFPPSPQRTRNVSPAPPQDAAAEEQGAAGEEWPPSPARNRGRAAPAPADEEPVEAHAGEEWPPSPARNRAAGSKYSPSPDEDSDAGLASGSAVEAWPRSPAEEGRAAQSAASAQRLAPSSNRKAQWPASPRRTPVPEVPQTPTDTEDGVNQTITPVDAVRGPSYDDADVTDRKLEFPLNNSPKEAGDAGPRQVRSNSTASTGSKTDALGRRRSVGFVDVPEGQQPLQRKGSGAELGAARRAVDLIREPSGELTPTAAKMKIHRLEEEIHMLRAGKDPHKCVLDHELTHRATAIFNAVDQLCQQDGNVSKDELRKVLRKETLGAKVLFHELDADDSGEIDLNEWLSWFGHLQRREAAENMLEWLEQELAVVQEAKEVSFACDKDSFLDKNTDTKAREVFERILNATESTETSVPKAKIEDVLSDVETQYTKELRSTGNRHVKAAHFVEWLEDMQRRGTNPVEVLTWTEQRLDLFDERQTLTSPARHLRNARDTEAAVNLTQTASEATTPMQETPAVMAGNGRGRGLNTTLETTNSELNQTTPADDLTPLADITPVDDVDGESAPGEGGYAGPLTEDLKQRAIACFHAIDAMGANTADLPQSEVVRALQMAPVEAKIMLKGLLRPTGDDITMADWIQWLDDIEASDRNAADMIAFMETKIADMPVLT